MNEKRASHGVNQEELIVSSKNGQVLDAGPFYHGTKADLKIGDLLQPGYNSNYGERAKANYVYMTATMDAVIWGAELAGGPREPCCLHNKKSNRVCKCCDPEILFLIPAI